MNTINPLVSAFAQGFFTCAALTLALFLMRFWRRSGDSLFLSFAMAFILMAINSLIPVLTGAFNDQEPAVYLFRLAAFGTIILGVLRKNFGR